MPTLQESLDDLQTALQDFDKRKLNKQGDTLVSTILKASRVALGSSLAIDFKANSFYVSTIATPGNVNISFTNQPDIPSGEIVRPAAEAYLQIVGAPDVNYVWPANALFEGGIAPTLPNDGSSSILLKLITGGIYDTAVAVTVVADSYQTA